MKKVAFGFLGSKLDAMGGFGHKRKEIWRPSIALAKDESLSLDRIELWYDPRFLRLAEQVRKDISEERDAPEVVLREIAIKDPWNFEEVYGFLFDFAESYPFRTDKEEYYVHLTTGTHVAQICLFLLTETRHFPGRIVQTSPRSESGQPSLSIIDLDLSRYDKLAQRFQQKLHNDLELLKAGINTRNVAFNHLISEIEQVARASTEPMMILGPTGAGKSHLAKQIYQLKFEQHQILGSFVDINCATIRGDQAMSALFGHAKGSFTGAVGKREGLLKKADRGLLFLDEIAELGGDEQAMLLRAIEEKTFLPLGSDEDVKSNFQLIAGTNKDLSKQVERGLFREDLLRRINTWSFTIPPLRDRREDIEPNLDYELRKFEMNSGRRITFSAEARESYLAFAMNKKASWDGNFRDLNASVIRLATLAPKGRITEDCVSREIDRLQKSWVGAKRESDEPSSDSRWFKLAQVGAEKIDLFDRPQLALVIRIISECSSLAEAGRKLFAVSREGREHFNDSDRIRKYLQRFGVEAKGLMRGGGGSGADVDIRSRATPKQKV